MKMWAKAFWACRWLLALVAWGFVSIAFMALTVWQLCTPADWPKVSLPFAANLASFSSMIGYIIVSIDWLRRPV